MFSVRTIISFFFLQCRLLYSGGVIKKSSFPCDSSTLASFDHMVQQQIEPPSPFLFQCHPRLCSSLIISTYLGDSCQKSETFGNGCSKKENK